MSDIASGLGSEGKPWATVWKVLAWAGGIVGAVFAAGIGYQQFMGGNATKGDVAELIEVHEAVPHGGTQTQIDKVNERLEPIEKGVNTLLSDNDERQKREKEQQLLDHYRAEYEECLGRRRGSCRKQPDHIKLEAEIADQLGIKPRRR